VEVARPVRGAGRGNGPAETTGTAPRPDSTAALSAQLPEAVRVLDPFHITRLGLDALDQVRRRVQQDTCGHRGRAGEPLYGIRRVLRRRRDRLSTKARARLHAGLLAGDPDGETALSWAVAQDLMGLYQLHDPDLARQRAEQLIADPRGCPIPELARLGRTLHAWRPEFLVPLRSPRRVERADRKPQPQDQEYQAEGPRISQLRQLSATPTTQPRTNPQRSLDITDPNPPSQVRGVEPEIGTFFSHADPRTPESAETE
jgi:hypothetical protein